MSFLIDGPWLYATGRAVGARASLDDGPAVALGAATIAGFWSVSVPLYLNRRWTRPIWRACRARSGRDWMLNSGMTRFDADRAGPGTHALAAVLFATYPVWLTLGYVHGRRR